MINPTAETESTYIASSKISEPLKEAILSNTSVYSYDMVSNQLAAKSETQKLRRRWSEQQAESLKQILTDTQKRAMLLATERCASNWLTTLPIEEFGFTLHKGAFHDALALRYDWKPNRTPSKCSWEAPSQWNMLFPAPKEGFQLSGTIKLGILLQIY